MAGQLQREFFGSERASQPFLIRVFHPDGVTGDGRRFMYDRDARGGILRFVRNSVVAHSWGYDPQGNRVDLSGSETVGSRLGFAGYVTHADTGLMFTPHRVYSARLRQWLSRDPLGDRDSIDGNNLYAYAANDPVNYTDPSGLNPVGLIYSAESAALNYATQSIDSLGTNCQASISDAVLEFAIGTATSVAAPSVVRWLMRPRGGSPAGYLIVDGRHRTYILTRERGHQSVEARIGGRGAPREVPASNLYVAAGDHHLDFSDPRRAGTYHFMHNRLDNGQPYPPIHVTPLLNRTTGYVPASSMTAQGIP
ncbi:MAG: RHS repeat-associated core domain-containing protein [Deltaproteobacteria bacterium]|nr:RHS repeat-associated core domain-containing protein [Deltaproteobacteria bacterium]